MYRNATKAIAALSVLVAVSFAKEALALGMSPPEIVSANALNGVPQTKSIRISRNPLDVGELLIKVSAKGEYAQYLTYEPEFVIPAGVDSYVYSFDIAPTTAAPGDYRIPLFFLLEIPPAPGSESSGSSIATGLAATVKITVTGERVVGYEFTGMEFDPLEAEMIPRLSVRISNVGNVDWKPERMSLSITDKNDPAHVISHEVGGDKMALAGAGKNATSVIELPKPIPEGEYVAVAEFFDLGVSVGTLTSNPFTVYPVGTLQQSGELVSVTSRKTLFVPGERILLGATFKNTGQTLLKGTMFTEVFKDGTYVDIVRGDELDVSPSQETSFAQAVTLDEPGSYALASYVKFGSQKSAIKDVSVTVEAPKIVAAANSKTSVAMLSGGVILAAGLFAAFRRFRRSRAQRSAPSVSSSVAPAPVAPTPVAPTPVAPAPVQDQDARW